MNLNKSTGALLALAIAAAIGGTALPAAPAFAAKQEAAATKLYPAATRAEPDAKTMSVTQANAKKINEIIKIYADPTKSAEVMSLTDSVLNDSKSNAFDKAYAAQIAGVVATNAKNFAKAITYYQTALSSNALSNDNHYAAMFNLAVAQSNANDHAGAAATARKFLTETNSKDPNALYILGASLYEQGQYAEAATQVKAAIDSTTTPNENWKQLYMLAMSKSGNLGGALAEAKKLADANPTNKVAQTNYIALLQQNKQDAEALAVMNRMRAANLLTTDADYRNLFLAMAPVEGAEQQVIDIINEGLNKKILTADYNVYAALAQSYYFLGQEGKAIENFEKAGPLSTKGTTYLNLARLYWNQGRNVDAKAAAAKAEAKGGLSNADMKTLKEIKALPDKGGKTVIIKKK